MQDQAVIDAYLGKHHDTDLGDDSLLDDDTTEQLEAEVRAEAIARGEHGGDLMSTTATDTSDAASVHRGAPTGEPLLDARDVYAGYLPGVDILNGCNLVVHPGELVGIIGPNGAGKSTLLKALFGLVTVRSGTVTLHGEDITHLRSDSLVKRGVGFVPQSNNVFPSLTIEENLQMGIFQAPEEVRRAVRRSSSTSSRRSASAASSGRARCRAASGRWSRWPGR